DPDDDLIIVKARVFGKHGDRILNLALDTAASHTHISPDTVDELGYSPVEGEAITSVRSAIGKEPGYMLRVKRFESLGFGFNDFLIHVHDLPAGFGIDGLLVRVELSQAVQLRDPFRRRTDPRGACHGGLKPSCSSPARATRRHPGRPARGVQPDPAHGRRERLARRSTTASAHEPVATGCRERSIDADLDRRIDRTAGAGPSG
ncbi:MAG: hypothetical protein E6J90_17230, partial [Deltaproteobacteria bacterium]